MGMKQPYQQPFVPVQPYAQQNMQAPPTAGRDGLLRQTDTPRLIAIGTLSVVVGGGLAYPLSTMLGEWVWAAFALTVLGIFIPLSYFDTLIRSGFFMRRMELRQEMQRLFAANNKVDAGQSAQIATLIQRVNELEIKLERLAAGKIEIHDKNGTRVVSKAGPEDEAAIAYVRDTIFGNGPMMAGIYDDGMLKQSYPFKPTAGEFQKAVHMRLAGAGLIEQARGKNANYYYRGPGELRAALDKLRRQTERS